MPDERPFQHANFDDLDPEIAAHVKRAEAERELGELRTAHRLDVLRRLTEVEAQVKNLPAGMEARAAVVRNDLANHRAEIAQRLTKIESDLTALPAGMETRASGLRVELGELRADVGKVLPGVYVIVNGRIDAVDARVRREFDERDSRDREDRAVLAAALKTLGDSIEPIKARAGLTAWVNRTVLAFVVLGFLAGVGVVVGFATGQAQEFVKRTLVEMYRVPVQSNVPTLPPSGPVIPRGGRFP